ncbi:MAG: hypothetical protein LBD63_04080, partial [Mycoplasmataceae bacterium]|nr:hypothetical protein [Mycoplasmataceae bacterium]
HTRAVVFLMARLTLPIMSSASLIISVLTSAAITNPMATPPPTPTTAVPAAKATLTLLRRFQMRCSAFVKTLLL